LNDDVSTEVFAEIGQTHNLVEKFSAWTQLKYDVIILSRLGEIDEADNIWVIQLPHDLNFLEDVGSLRQRVSAWASGAE
jgi:hypothetical protein